jgi:beta-glucosidase
MAGRTYRYAAHEPLYPFGFGLSYTSFTYSNLRLGKQAIQAGEPLFVHLTVANTGAVAGDEVVQLYLADLEASVVVPLCSLVGFKRLHLQPGEQQKVEFTILPEQMALVDDSGKSILEPGKFRLVVGGCSPSVRGQTLGAPQPISAEFAVK